VCGICVFAAYVALLDRSALSIPFLLVGLLFNPFIPAHVNREFWIAADVIVAVGFVAVARLAPRLDAARLPDAPLIEPTSASESQPAEISS
jgi:hypothetical protein